MSSNQFTRLLLQRVRELTNPNRPTEEIEDDLREYYSALAEFREHETIFSREEIDSLQQQISRMQEELGQQFSDKERNIAVEFDLSPHNREILEAAIRSRLSAIEEQLRSLTRMNEVNDALKSMENRVNQIKSESIGSTNAEETIVQEYFSMDDSDFDSMTPEMHILFLESMLQPHVTIPATAVQRLVKTYREHPNNIVRYLVVHVMLKMHFKDNYVLRVLFDSIYENYDNDSREMLFVELVNILVDLGNNMITLLKNKDMVNPAFKALDELVQFEQPRGSSYLLNTIQKRLEAE